MSAEIEIQDEEIVTGSVETDEQPRREEHPPTPLERTSELSAEVLESLEAGQRAAIDAVRRFLDTVDRAMPPRGGEQHSAPHEIVDSALEMADRLVQTQYEFVRRVIDSAGWALGRHDQ